MKNGLNYVCAYVSPCYDPPPPPLDIEVILNMLKATTGILYLVNIILLSIPQYFHF